MARIVVGEVLEVKVRPREEPPTGNTLKSRFSGSDFQGNVVV